MPVLPNYGWTTPTEGGSPGTWDTILNTLFGEADSDLKAAEDTAADALAGVNEQPLISVFEGVGYGWQPTNDSFPSMASSTGSDGPLMVPLGRHLRTGRRITGFTSYGRITTGAATVSLWKQNADGTQTSVSAGHSVPGSAGATTTSGLTEDVVANKTYFLRVGSDGGSAGGQVTMRYFQLTVIDTP